MRHRLLLLPLMRRLKNLAILVLASALLLELVLQVGSLVVWLVHRGAGTAPSGSGARVVLCVGDSFTYGIGSTVEGRSYPGQLHDLVRAELGDEWRVVNGGWPGQSSRDVLERLDSSLRESQPEFVYVLVGANDGWRHPEHLVLAQAPAASPAVRAYRFVWRTKLLATWVAGQFAAPAAQVEERVEERVAALRQRLAQDSSEDTALELLAALRAHGDADGARQCVLQMTQQFGESGRTWAQVAWQRVADADHAGAARAVDRALELLPAEARPLRARLLRARAILLLATDAKAAAEAAAEASRLDGRTMSPETMAATMDEIAPLELDRIYESHLGQIIARCRGAQAEPVLLSYPTQGARLERCIQRVASRSGVAWLDVASEFARRIEGIDRADYFIADGHCNDAGYGVLAEIVLDDLRRRVAR